VYAIPAPHLNSPTAAEPRKISTPDLHS